MDNSFLLNNILKSDGTNQGQRLLPALDPDYIKVDGRGIKEILRFTYKLSKEIKFFNLNNDEEGDWRSFFDFFIDPATDDISISEEEIIAVMKNKSDFEPHFALFLAFVKLFKFAQNDINSIARRHIDFYYRDALRLTPKPAQPDTVHILFELAKNAPPHKLDAGTLLTAGKDDNGNPLLYKTQNEIILNRAQVAGLKSVFADKINSQSRIYMAPVANSADGLGALLEGNEPKWSAFGESQRHKIEDTFTMTDANMGFALASPMLLLKEGDRTIILTLRFNAVEYNIPNLSQLKSAFTGYLSGETGWIQPEIKDARLEQQGTGNPKLGLLEITLNLPPDFPAVVPYNEFVLLEGYSTSWPLLKLLLNPDAYFYDSLSDFTLSTASILVDVKGVKDVILQNDQAAIDPGKPFMPFGSQPAIGSNFYIGSGEVFQKRLQSLTINITWNEIPPLLSDHYKTYYQTTINDFNTIFRAKINLLLKKSWEAELINPLILFDSELADKPRNFIIDAIWINNATLNLNYTRNPYLQVLHYDHTTIEGFIKLELTQPLTPFKAFGHKEFPSIYTQQAIALSKFDPASNGQAPKLPNPPYTPSIGNLSLDYTSQEEIFLGSQVIEQFFSIGPFGHHEINQATPYLLPQIASEGNFYIGLNNFTPPQNISLLFQLAEGSSQADIIPDPEGIIWSYLSGNQWIAFDNLQILLDTTQGLQRSGIISFTIPQEASTIHTSMPAGICWLKAEITQYAAGISKMISVNTQSMEAVFVLENDNDAEKYTKHLNAGLFPNRINTLVKKDAVIKSVYQPYSSFGGRGKEDNNPFYVRVSERLRHKNRTMMLWDYERMVLEAFPSIFKVKCLNHTNANFEIVPGYVTLIVVSNIRNKNSVDPLEPKTSTSTLSDIKSYLLPFTPSYMQNERLKVENPVYEQMLVDIKVGYYKGKDPGYYGNLLNEEIKRFLSPWAFEEGRDIVFGGKIYKSDILTFIEEREYVDFIKDFQLYHIHASESILQKGIGKMIVGQDLVIKKPKPPGIGLMTIGHDFVIGEDVEVAIATSSRSILVSYKNHRISEATTGLCEGITDLGIGYMTVAIDLLVNESI